MDIDIDSLCWRFGNTDGSITGCGSKAETLTMDKLLAVIEECKPVIYIYKQEDGVIWACNLPDKPRFCPSALIPDNTVYAIANLGIVASDNVCKQLQKLIRLEWTNMNVDFKKQMEKLFGAQNEKKI